MNELIEQYNNAIEAIYKHVGFVEDYVIYPIDDFTHMFWDIDGESIFYATTQEGVFDENGEQSYQSEVFKQRFYQKHIYEGQILTMIFSNPGVDGMKYFAIFDNSKRIKNLNP